MKSVFLCKEIANYLLFYAKEHSLFLNILACVLGKKTIFAHMLLLL